MAPVVDQNIVEVPLDPEYLTEAGFYQAGYNWGHHVRTVQGGLPDGANEMFRQGVEDGYGDVMEAINEKIRKDREYDWGENG